MKLHACAKSAIIGVTGQLHDMTAFSRYPLDRMDPGAGLEIPGLTAVRTTVHRAYILVNIITNITFTRHTFLAPVLFILFAQMGGWDQIGP